jgi:hypothetical protein
MSRETVRKIVNEAPEVTAHDTWPEPDMRIIEDDRAPAPRLENDALPAGWDGWITADADARACPPDYIAAALIGAASAWIGNSRRVAATADWTEPLHLWMALVGAPSAGKSPALAPMIDASRLLECEEETAWHEALTRYESDAEAARVADKVWRKAVSEAIDGGMVPPDRPVGAETPETPPRPRLLAMNSSTEELQRLLAQNPRGLISLRDELAGWFGEFDRYGGRGGDRGFYLEAWNGGAYVCDRVKYHDTPVRIEHASVALLGGIVPDRLREALTGPDDGLAARMIYVWPDPAPIVPLSDRGDVDAIQRRTILMAAARRLRALVMGTDNNGKQAPHALRLSAEALVLFDELRRELMMRARSAHGLAAGWAGKNPGRALRLAGVYELLTWAACDDAAEPSTISADAVARGGNYLDYAAGMLDRVTAGLAISRADADAVMIARHLLATRATVLNERGLYQTAGFAWARDKKRREDAHAVLDQAGWIRRAPNQRRRRDWDISPRLRGG